VGSGNIEQNEEWVVLGHQFMLYFDYLIDRKLSSKEKKIVIKIEHFDQNELVQNKYYSVNEALANLL
jgi:hypothetical protein